MAYLLEDKNLLVDSKWQTVHIPKIFKWYAVDFGGSQEKVRDEWEKVGGDLVCGLDSTVAEGGRLGEEPSPEGGGREGLHGRVHPIRLGIQRGRPGGREITMSLY